jgi:hypothetical protein
VVSENGHYKLQISEGMEAKVVGKIWKFQNGKWVKGKGK